MKIKKHEMNEILKKHKNHIRTDDFIQNIECVNKYNMISEITLKYINDTVTEDTSALFSFGDGKEGVIEIATLANIAPDSMYNRIRISSYDPPLNSVQDLKKLVLKKIERKNIFY